MTCPQSTQSRVRTDLVSSGDRVGSLGLSAGSSPLGQEAGRLPMLGHPGQGRRARSTRRPDRRGPHTQWACSSRAHTQQACGSKAHGKKAGRSWAHRRPAGSPQSSWRGTQWHGAGCGQGRGQGWSRGSFPGAAFILGCGVLAMRHPGVFLVAACCLSSSSPPRVSSWGFQWQ